MLDGRRYPSCSACIVDAWGPVISADQRCWYMFLAQVVEDVASGSPAMVLTTATVQSGASGGAVLSPSGALIALVTSNARHTASGAVIPNLNFGIAAPALRPLWDHLAAGRVREIGIEPN